MTGASSPAAETARDRTAARMAIICRLYPVPYRPHVCAFNLQQFDRLAARYAISLVVPVPWHEWLVHHKKLAPTRRGSMNIRYAGWLFPPKVRVVYPTCFGLSLLRTLPWLKAARPSCLLVCFAYPDAVAGVALSRALGVPLLIKAHGSDLNVHAAHPLHAAQLRWAARHASAVICVSEALERRARELGVPADKLVVVHNGVDLARFAPMPKRDARIATGLPEDRRLILFVGNVIKTKGVHELWHAFARLAAQDIELELVVVGDGPELAWLQRQAKSAVLAHRTRLVGRVAHDELGAWFNAADVVCLPSYREGIPNVLLEATACGVPIVATRVGGIPELVTQATGELVEAGDAAALEAGLRSALGRTWDRAAIAGHAARFAWESNIDAMSQLIDRAIAGG